MRAYFQNARHFRGATELKHILISILLIAVSLAAGMMLRGGTTQAPGNPDAPKNSSAKEGETSKLGAVPPEAKSPFARLPQDTEASSITKSSTKDTPVEMTPAMKKIADPFLHFKDEMKSATPNVAAAQADLESIASMFDDLEHGKMIQGSFIHLSLSLPPTAMPMIASIFDLPLAPTARVFLLDQMISNGGPELNQAIASWFDTTKDFVALEQSLPVLSTVMNKGLFLNAVKTLLKDSRGEAKIPPEVRWLAADILFECGGQEAMRELMTLATKDADEKIRNQAGLLLKAMSPNEDCIMVLGNKKWSSEKDTSTWALQSGDVIRSFDNVEYHFPGQIEAVLVKKAPESTAIVIFRRNGVDETREILVSDLVKQFNAVKLHAARIGSAPRPAKTNEGL